MSQRVNMIGRLIEDKAESVCNIELTQLMYISAMYFSVIFHYSFLIAPQDSNSPAFSEAQTI